MNAKKISINRQLKTAGILTFTVALFQAVITTSPKWSLYFGAGKELVSKIWLLYLTGYIVALLFVLFGFYALSGSGVIKPLPLLRTGLVIICALFIIRGLFLILEILFIADVVETNESIPAQSLVSSAVSLIIGLFYLVGITGNWKKLSSFKK